MQSSELRIELVDITDRSSAQAVSSIICACAITWRPTADEIFDDWASTPDHVDEVRYLIFDSDVPVGFARIGTYRYVVDPGRALATIMILKTHRQRGLATLLVSKLQSWIEPRSLREVWVSIDLNSEGVNVGPGSEAMARKYGFEPRESRFESRLSTSTFDPEVAKAAIEALQVDGITITTAASLELTNNNWAYELYELDTLAMADEPTEQAGEASDFETWRAEFLDGHNLEGVIVAMVRNQFVGLSIHWKEQTDLLVASTAVHPSFRGRGIARALKLAGAAYGRSQGLNLRAYNFDANEHIVTLNKSLGFVRQSGQLYGRRVLNHSEPINSPE